MTLRKRMCPKYINATDSTDLIPISTVSLCSSSDLPSLLRWGWQCLGHSDTSSGSSAPMASLQLHKIIVQPILHTQTWPQSLQCSLFPTFSVLILYLHYHFFLAVQPQQPLFLGRWSLINLLSETVHVLRAPCQVASLTYKGTSGRFILLAAQST